MTEIVDIHAREILDFRGIPDRRGRRHPRGGSSRTGGSARPAPRRGARRAAEKRDGDASRYLGKGVLTAVDNVNDKSPARCSASKLKIRSRSTRR